MNPTPQSMSDLPELQPCPFCGRADMDQWPCEWLDGTGANVIRCAWCHGAAPAKVWNCRATAEQAGKVEGWVHTDRDWLRPKKDQVSQRPAKYERRMRPTFDKSATWSPWEECTAATVDDIRRTPILHDWEHETRALYAAPSREVEALANFFEGVRVFVTSREKIKHPEGTDLFDEYCRRLRALAPVQEKAP